MEKLKAIIIEDNAFMAAMLKDMLHEMRSNVELVRISSTGEDGIKQIRLLHPDIIFLDIELPDMTGFEMLSHLTDLDFKVIFTTAHSHYAIKVFRFNA